MFQLKLAIRCVLQGGLCWLHASVINLKVSSEPCNCRPVGGKLFGDGHLAAVAEAGLRSIHCCKVLLIKVVAGVALSRYRDRQTDSYIEKQGNRGCAQPAQEKLFFAMSQQVSISAAIYKPTQFLTGSGTAFQKP